MKKLILFLTLAAALLTAREASADPTLPSPVTSAVVADPTTGVLKWPTAPNFLTNLGATTVGGNLLKLTNPTAVRYLRINADNTVTARTAAEMATDLGIGTGDSPQFTAINIGHVSDTTLARSSAGRLSIEGVNIVNTSSIDALSNKTYEGLTITTSTGTITITNGKTLSLSNTLTFTGTDGSSVAFGTGGTVAYTANKLSEFAATTSAELAGVLSDETGSGGGFVRATSPTISSPIITNIAPGANFTITASNANVPLTIVNSGAGQDALHITGGILRMGTTTATCAAGRYLIIENPDSAGICLSRTSATTGKYSFFTRGTGDFGFYDELNSRYAINIEKSTGYLDAVNGLKVAAGTAITKLLSASSTLDFPSIAANGGSQDLTITVTGAATGDVVALGLPSAPATGVVFNGFVSASNTVTIRATNATAGAIDPASATFRAMVTHF